MAARSAAPLVRASAPFHVFPMIRELGRMQLRHSGRLAPHRNAGIEICAIRRGRYDWHVEGRRYTLGPGDGFVTLPWQAHGGVEGAMQRGALDFVVIGLERCGTGQAWRWGSWCPLDLEARRFVERTLLANPSALVPRAEGLAACFDRLFGELREQGPGHRGQVHAHLAELLLSTARLVARPREPEPDDSLVRGALAGIGARLDEPWSLATMAATAGLGRSRFSERVLELTGLTPKRWLEQQRLLHARRLLEGNASVTEIAFRVGYSSSQYFATAFRRDSGMSPLEWRSRRRHEENRRAPPA